MLGLQENINKNTKEICSKFDRSKAKQLTIKNQHDSKSTLQETILQLSNIYMYM